MWGVVTLSFFLIRMMPGGPIDYLRQDIRQNPLKYGLSDNPSADQIRTVIRQYANVPPEKPVFEAYVDYLFRIVQGDFGNAILLEGNANVLMLILNRAPWTIFLSSIGLIYGVLFGIITGSLMAYYEGSKFDVGATVFMILDRSVPYYLVAIFLLYYLSFRWGWFPQGGRQDPNAPAGMNVEFIRGVLEHAALPAFSFMIVGIGGNALGLRANAIRLLGANHLRVARLRGLSSYRIATSYLARNAILPMYTGIIIGLGGLLGGSIIMEEIFNYQGMGLLMLEAVQASDWPVMMGNLIITVALFVIGTLIADFTYSLVDPRADLRGME
jgi:peptide/nickel transport system permease protein